MPAPAPSATLLVGRLARVLEREDALEAVVVVPDPAAPEGERETRLAVPAWAVPAVRAARSSPSVTVELDAAGAVRSIAF